jgi:hypothetical protein
LSTSGLVTAGPDAQVGIASMPDYDLSGLSPRSFERLVQALAAKILGPGVVVFGDGPDGGREATYRGRVPFPSDVESWNGYIVVQAKFLQRSRDPGRDGRWAEEQLTQELEAFLDPQKHRHRPEYYILATNITLTPAAGRGGKDRLDAVFERFQKRLSLKGWRIWDHDLIGAFLDANADIRRAYAAWTTPGDVLSAVIDELRVERPDFPRVMRNYLAKELLSDQYSKLGQAGHATDYKIPLASVFVDLPVTNKASAGLAIEREANSAPGLVAEIIDLARERFDSQPWSETALGPAGSQPQSLSSRVLHTSERLRLDSGTTTKAVSRSLFDLWLPEPGRLVLVGGPGQGKTTISQLACQLFRVALLLECADELPPEVRHTLAALLKQCCSEGPALPTARRFPVRVVLSAFADALARDAGLSLLAYIARQIERVTEYAVDPDDLRAWLGSYPWFVVLDGLDEVPASTNRDAVLAAVRNFWVDAAEAQADLLLLATTRPQGYNDDFSPTIYRHVWLAPLSLARAMHYARRLAASRWGAGTEPARRVVGYLESASLQENTARLMRTPLQVTIMAALVDQIGPPPQDRWRLFSRYYDVIYGREQERDILASKLLREHRPDIDAIHGHVALALQLESERAGGAEARMPAQLFEQIVIARLQDEEHDEESLATLTAEIVDAATNRLVFLVSPRTGEIGFEIRSLQEFMAAEALTRGGDREVQDRLRGIAAPPSWRNVVLFAAGRCFTQDQHRRDTVCAICQELNTADDPLLKWTMAGSILALELLEDGVANQQPRYARMLAGLALGILDLSDWELHGRLAAVCTSSTETLFKDAIEQRLEKSRAEAMRGWSCLLALLGSGHEWAKALADALWPADRELRQRICNLPMAMRAGHWISHKVAQLFDGCSYRFFLSPGRDLIAQQEPGPEDSVVAQTFWCRATPFLSRPRPKREYTLQLGTGAVRLTFEGATLDRSSDIPDPSNFDLSSSHGDWLIVASALEFASHPSRQTLARALEAAGESSVPAAWLDMPWPYAACAETGDLRKCADFCRQGQLGDLSDWRAAEARWSTDGVNVADILHMIQWPFDSQIGHIGFPFGVARWSAIGASQWRELLELYRNLRGNGGMRSTLAWMLIDRIQREQLAQLTAEELLRMLRAAPSCWIHRDVLQEIAEHASQGAAWLACLDEIGQHHSWYPAANEPPSEDQIRTLGALVAPNLDLPGVLYLLAEAIVQGGTTPQGIGKVRAAKEMSPRTRSAAIVVELVTNELQASRAKELARMVSDLARIDTDQLELFDRLVKCLNLSQDTTTLFLAETYRLLNPDLAEARTLTMMEIAAALRRHRSDLLHPKVWRDLKLPQRLFDILAS